MISLGMFEELCICSRTGIDAVSSDGLEWLKLANPEELREKLKINCFS